MSEKSELSELLAELSDVELQALVHNWCVERDEFVAPDALTAPRPALAAVYAALAALAAEEGDRRAVWAARWRAAMLANDGADQDGPGEDDPDLAEWTADA
jgi:hypothetical protein